MEFLINDHIVPHSMTIYQAVRQFSSVSKAAHIVFMPADCISCLADYTCMPADCVSMAVEYIIWSLLCVCTCRLEVMKAKRMCRLWVLLIYGYRLTLCSEWRGRESAYCSLFHSYRLISQSDIPVRPKRALSLPNTPGMHTHVNPYTLINSLPQLTLVQFPSSTPTVVSLLVVV